MVAILAGSLVGWGVWCSPDSSNCSDQSRGNCTDVVLERDCITQLNKADGSCRYYCCSGCGAVEDICGVWIHVKFPTIT